MLKKLPRRLAAPVAAAIVTSAVVAAIALGGSSGTQAALQGSPPAPSGQPAGQIVIEGGAPIQVLSFSWGASNPSIIGLPGGGAGAGKVSFSTFNFMKNVDASSSALFLACAQGKRLRDAAFTAQWGTGPGAAKLVLEFTDVFVDSVQQSGGGSAPSESVSINYAKIKWTFTDANGTTTGGWDIAHNEGA